MVSSPNIVNTRERKDQATETTQNYHHGRTKSKPKTSTASTNAERKDQSTETVQESELEPRKSRRKLNKSIAGTSAEVLTSYTSAEVHTRPCDSLASESDRNNKPVENVSVSISLKVINT